MKFLSADWAAHPALTGIPPLAGGFTGRLQTVIAGTPDGDVRLLSTYADGACTGTEPATDKTAELTLTVPYADAVKVLDGDIGLNALFMSGRMKTAGPTGPLLDLLAALESPAGAQARTTLAAATDER